MQTPYYCPRFYTFVRYASYACVLIYDVFNSVSILKPYVTANWGTWGRWSHCKEGEYVVGMQVKAESYQGEGPFVAEDNNYDDSGINAIRLKCSDGEVLTSAEGVEGAWRGWKYVAEGRRIVRVSLRSQWCHKHCDDTGTHGLRFRDSKDKRAIYEPWTGYWMAHGFSWVWPTDIDLHGYAFHGSWSTAICPWRTAISGFRTQVEPDQGGGDDTGLNRVEFKCGYNRTHREDNFLTWW